jgi:hypothetical protein
MLPPLVEVGASCSSYLSAVESAKSAGVDITTKLLRDTGHEFPPEFELIIEEFLNL